MTRTRHAVVRADASTEIGTGHVVRCQTLATELLRRGWTVTLASRDLPPGLAESTRAAGIGLVDLPAGTTIDDEPAFIGSALSGPVALVVIDHYGIGADWQRAVAPWAERLLAIDDLADRFQAVDLLLNQNLPADEGRYRGLVAPETRILSGPGYALVRPEFAAARERGRRRDGRLERILVFISGTDPHDVTRPAARGAAGLGVAVDVVVGAGYPFLAELRAWAAGRPLVELHVDTHEMAALMERADVAVGAPGSASWERCTLGLPAVLVTLAANQAEGARALAEAGAAVDLGWHGAVAADDVENALSGLRDDPGRLVAMAEATARITDGRGTARVADAIERLVAGAA
jgi:UDP-2,4-diacetamido-2,4,6-trideoxy-beta-L-altropyranose hydrolase